MSGGRLGVMQGRLLPPSDASRIQSFPRNGWEREFALAAQAQLSCIEWIYDTYGRDVNPITSDEGIRTMRGLQQQSGVRVSSVVADYYMDRLLISDESAVDDLAWLLSRCAAAGVTRVVLPFVDASSLKDERMLDEAVRVLDTVIPTAERCAVELHLETDLSPAVFAKLLARLEHALVKVNYDSGNSASLGFDVSEEFAAYGRRIGSVHLKDRARGGVTVKPGSGDADFATLFTLLRDARYAGDLILQIARGAAGEELDWTIRNRQFFEPYLKQLTA